MESRWAQAPPGSEVIRIRAAAATSPIVCGPNQGSYNLKTHDVARASLACIAAVREGAGLAISLSRQRC